MQTVVIALVLAALVSIAFAQSVCDSTALATLCDVTGTTVDCTGQHLTLAPCGIPSTTTVLKLAGNTITAIDSSILATLTSLTTLDLGSNGITSLPAGAFAAAASTLTTLILANNQLTSLNGALSDLTNLQELNIAGNQFSGLSTADFTGLTALWRLDVSNNHIAWLDSDAFSATTITAFYCGITATLCEAAQCLDTCGSNAVCTPVSRNPAVTYLTVASRLACSCLEGYAPTNDADAASASNPCIYTCSDNCLNACTGPFTCTGCASGFGGPNCTFINPAQCTGQYPNIADNTCTSCNTGYGTEQCTPFNCTLIEHCTPAQRFCYAPEECSRCRSGYKEPSCTPYPCPAHCYPGQQHCIGSYQCGSCLPGYQEPSCTPYECDSQCSSQSQCAATGDCQSCNAGYFGPTCTPYTCSAQCSSQSHCIADDTCTSCVAGYSGPSCAAINNCNNNNGLCGANTCLMTGPGTSSCACTIDRDCGLNSACVMGVCACNGGFTAYKGNQHHCLTTTP